MPKKRLVTAVTLPVMVLAGAFSARMAWNERRETVRRQELTPAYEQESRSLYREQGRLEEELAGCAGHHGICRELPPRAEEGPWPIEAGDSNDSAARRSSRNARISPPEGCSPWATATAMRSTRTKTLTTCSRPYSPIGTKATAAADLAAVNQTHANQMSAP